VRSRFYTGTVAHRRTDPVLNAFSYGVYYLLVDLAELSQLDAELKHFGHNRRALVSVWDSDHGARDGSPLRPWIDALVAQAGIDLTGGSVLLLTFPRVFRFRFYPVSFWYCFGADGLPRAVLAEVQNTFRDHHNYLLHNDGEPFDWTARPSKAKAFYVSPFVQRENVCHEFAFSEPADRLAVTIADRVSGEMILTTTLSLQAQPLTDAALMRAAWRVGPVSVRALILIHWQALKLVAKRVPFFAHTPPPSEETSL